jgi:4-carboxymuconolactone decarboxylase
MALTERERRLVRLSVAIVLGRWDDLRALRRAAPSGEPDRGWREAFLQSHLFAGFPRAVEAGRQLELSGGLGRLDPDEIAPADSGTSAPSDSGQALFDRIYAADASGVRASLDRYHPELGRWILAHAYGRVLVRPGLGAVRRELLACACLAVTEQERQLRSHARGALRCGAALDELEQALALATEGAAEPIRSCAARVLDWARAG